jgi:hypothetical protein
VRTTPRALVRPAVFIAANGAAALVLGLALIRPGIDFLQDQRRRIEQGALALERVRSTIARNEAASAIGPEQIEAAARRFIQGNSEGLQNADLLGRLRQTADEQGVSLGSATTLPPRQWAERRLVGARVEFNASTERAARVLADLEYGPALLFVERAKLSPNPEEGDDSVAVTVEVYGVAQWPDG